MKKVGNEDNNLDDVEPIDHGTVAKPHTPVYKMHRYFARRPYSVFRELIGHYSNPDSIILDPFCGGGVTVIESLRLRRKVIGVDLNPMATFITRMEAIDVNLNELKKAFKEIESAVKDEIEELYLTRCPKCGKETPADWFEWSNILQCPKCKKNVILAEAKKLGPGRYECYHCGYDRIKLLECKVTGEKIVKLRVKCPKCGSFEKEPDGKDLKKIREIEGNFDRIIKEKKLWYPKDKIFKGEKTRELLTKEFKYFYELFTKRNLLALAILFGEIKRIKDKKIKELTELAFTSGLYEDSKLSHLKGGTVVKPGHHYWLANLFSEINVWYYFANRFKAVLKGKAYSQQEINGFYKEASTFKDLENNGTCYLLSKSSTNLPIPDESIDVIITDPPYGGNVNYTELSDFWTIWLKDPLGLKEGLIENNEEAIINKYQKKGLKEYRDLMFKVFKECHRILKPNRWMVMTFHNRNFQVWNAIHLAAHDAGFILPEKDGMIYQSPIQQYTTTLHQRAGGSMLGDFILSFKKVEELPKEKLIKEVEIGSKIKKIASETIEYHGGARLTTIYNRLIPFLLNNGLLHKIGQNDIVPWLNKWFVEKGGKWYFRENIDETGKLKPIEFVPVEVRIEYIIRSLLYAKSIVSMDEVLTAVYTNLINANAPEYEEIVRVLSRIGEKTKAKGKQREVWQLKERGTLAQKKLQKLIKRKKKERVPELYSEESTHDLIIEKLIEIGEKIEYDSHVGETEQRKYKKFRDISLPMANNVQYGLNGSAFSIIKEIDELWIKGDAIVAAFEVEKSTSIDSGINRFRNLFAAMPTSNIPAYIIIPDKREKEAKKKIGSLANRKAGLTERIKYVLFSDILKKDIKDIEKIARKVV